jgi:hypothetical protein
MKTLTVAQPWAFALIHAGKTIENRPWRTHHRGKLAIHAGKSRAFLRDTYPDGSPAPAPQDLAFGVLIGVVDLVDCVPSSDPSVQGNPWADGSGWCWILENPRAVEPIKWRGQQRLFNVPDQRIVYIQEPLRVSA